MTHRRAYEDAIYMLKQGPVMTATPELDARVLMEFCFKKSWAHLLTIFETEVSIERLTRLVFLMHRRQDGEPVAWITGKKEFMGLDFSVGEGILVPRPDTETLVEAALEVLSVPVFLEEVPKVVDVCTGSGCVAISLIHYYKGRMRLSAGDLSPVAVETAKANSKQVLPPYKPVVVVQSDLLAQLPGPWDMILSNPPYLTPAEVEHRVTKEGWMEPALALDGGDHDGLAIIRRLTEQAAQALNPGGWYLLEAADAQMEVLETLFQSHQLVNIRIWKDLAGQRRVIGGQRPSR